VQQAHFFASLLAAGQPKQFFRAQTGAAEREQCCASLPDLPAPCRHKFPCRSSYAKNSSLFHTEGICPAWSAQGAMLLRRLLGAVHAPFRAPSSHAARWASVLIGSVKELRSCLNKKAPATRVVCAPGTPAAPPVEATVRGWVRSARHQKAVSFLEVVDGSCVHGLQVVLDVDRVFGTAAAATAAPSSTTSDSVPAVAAAAAAVDTRKALTTGCSVEVSGKLLPHPKQAGLFELHGDRVKVLGECPPEKYPLQKKSVAMPAASTAQPAQLSLSPRPTPHRFSLLLHSRYQLVHFQNNNQPGTTRWTSSGSRT
jgi:hypothetical protein